MWVSDKWKEYELIDCSGGDRLERWGDRILIRPDPQVLWHTPKDAPGWQMADAQYIRSNTGGGKWSQNDLPGKWPVAYGELEFLVSPMNFKHMGLFPEQAVNWDYIIEKIRASSNNVNILNLFAYTGGATLAAAYAGANVCHVDAARGMVARAKENAAASGLGDKPVRWIVDDCGKFVEREIRRGHMYDALIMDPPSYGRGPSGEVWKLEDSIYDFVKLCSGVLAESPLFVLINSYTTGLSPSTLSYIITSVLGGTAESDELGLPVTSSGMCLPCGAACRWSPR
ncbi:MAG: class I SAM-dependent methyltransferase [Oscillospiraceae bacterium]|nr:class I SAM-dependent methyltransferase [Oscillospiraceae bacterium]